MISAHSLRATWPTRRLRASLQIGDSQRHTTRRSWPRTLAIACAGYHVTAKAGHHKISFDSIKLALGSGANKS